MKESKKERKKKMKVIPYYLMDDIKILFLYVNQQQVNFHLETK